MTALVFTVSALIQKRIDLGETPSIGWQALAHLLLASSEVLVSITCLKFSYTQAPKKMKSFIMAVFFLTGQVNEYIQNEDGTSNLPGASYYWFFVKIMLVTAVLFIPVVVLYKEKTYIQDEAQTESVT